MPSASGAGGVELHDPLVSTVASVVITTSSLTVGPSNQRTVTVPASPGAVPAVPRTSGVSEDSVAPGAGAVMVGAGAVVSGGGAFTLKVTGVLVPVPLPLPAEACAVQVPASRSAGSVVLQVPPLAVAVVLRKGAGSHPEVGEPGSSPVGGVPENTGRLPR